MAKLAGNSEVELQEVANGLYISGPRSCAQRTEGKKGAVNWH